MKKIRAARLINLCMQTWVCQFSVGSQTLKINSEIRFAFSNFADVLSSVKLSGFLYKSEYYL